MRVQQDVVAKKGKLSLPEYLRCRVRYFADGAVLGTRAYVDEVFQQDRERFGPKRKDGARKLRHLQTNGLFSLRDLRIGAVG